MSRVLDAILSTPWAIKPEWLRTITDIAQRHNEDPAALQARLGRPLDNTRSATVRDSVAIIPVTGPIFPRANIMTELSGATSLSELSTDLRQALDNPNVSAIVLEIDSPGGVAFGVQEMADMIYTARGEKTVVAYVEGMGASAAYELASAAGELVISASGMVGSIGVVQAMSVQEDTDRDGYRDFEIVSSNAPNKRPDPRTDEGLTEIRAALDALEAEFINSVARNRGVSRETVMTKFGAGGMKVGIGAVNAGMADRVGSMEQILAELAARPKGNPAAPATRHQSEETEMSLKDVTAEQLRAEQPELVAAIEAAAADKARADGEADGREAGAVAERERIEGIRALSEPGVEAMIGEMVADGKTTPDQAAGRILAAQKASRKAKLSALETEDAGTAVAASQDSPETVRDPKALAAAARAIVDEEAAAGRRISVAAAMQRVKAGN